MNQTKPEDLKTAFFDAEGLNDKQGVALRDAYHELQLLRKLKDAVEIFVTKGPEAGDGDDFADLLSEYNNQFGDKP